MKKTFLKLFTKLGDLCYNIHMKKTMEKKPYLSKVDFFMNYFKRET
jgi:hypothetical protein